MLIHKLWGQKLKQFEDTSFDKREIHEIKCFSFLFLFFFVHYHIIKNVHLCVISVTASEFLSVELLDRQLRS